MKYTVTRACGHVETVELFGKAADREKKIAWLESTECHDCYYGEGCEEVEMSYAEYKNNYADCKTKNDSYNRQTKTIVVYVPVEEEETEEVAETETTETTETIETVAEATEATEDLTKQLEETINMFFGKQPDPNNSPADLSDIIEIAEKNGLDNVKAKLMDYMLQYKFNPLELTLRKATEIASDLGCAKMHKGSYVFPDLWFDI